MAFSHRNVASDLIDTSHRIITGDAIPREPDREFNDDEILITLNVPRIGNVEMMAYIYGEVAYLPVKDLFDFLKIKNTASPDFDSVQGFFINPAAKFLVDRINNRIVYENRVFNLKKNDIIRTETNLYLRSDYFGEVFGLECTFNFRALSVTLNTKLELPAIREMQQELMRKNISRLNGERKADTNISRSFPLFHLGMVDWAVASIQQEKGKTNSLANLAIGAIVAGGEANLSLNYDNREPFNMKKQYYNWRFVNNDHASLRQVTVGKIFTQSISSLYAPVTGVQFTNTPTTYRRSFGTYTLSRVTEPGWTVELYVNNVLLNYTKADASGFFTFQVPLVYGNSILKLRFYGPLGEEEVKELVMNIPFNFVPEKQLEYTVTAGIVDDEHKGRFSRANFNYGLSRRITIGGGMEYLSTVKTGKSLPYLNASLRLGQNMLVSVEQAYKVRTKVDVNFQLPSSLQFDLNYTRYNKVQTSVLYNYIEEKKIVISMPIQGRKFTAFSRLTLNEFTLPYNPYIKPTTKTVNNSAEFLLSVMVSGISSNFTTYAIFNNKSDLLIYSNLSLAFRLPAGIRFRPEVKYEYRQNNFRTVKGEIEKNVFRNGFMNFSWERDLISHMSAFGMGLRYNFSFAQTTFSSSRSNHISSITESVRGSLMYNGRNKYLKATNQSNVGKGGLIIAPFLDINCNGRRDPGEPKAFGLKFRINGGRMDHNNKDTTILIYGLEAYSSYYIELDKNSFDNISWRIPKPTISIVINPNELRLVEVPVSVVGEASGSVSTKQNGALNGLGRIIVSIYNSDSSLAAQTLTESDGFFSYLGLAPGIYIARVDATQLEKLNMSSSAGIQFTIKAGDDGDVKDNLGFVLEMKANVPSP